MTDDATSFWRLEPPDTHEKRRGSTKWNASDPMFAGRLDVTRVAAMGTEYGGAVVAEFGRTDSRCKAVIALDPTYGPFTELNVPLLEITTPGENDTSLYTVATNNCR